ncbi:hypothetical protein, partial [Mesorhizobium sp.]|uniref:hypothetical protein n=1 Tax=Mesorhizobium sp. TaxID=1871066 RepID=UPI0025F4584E
LGREPQAIEAPVQAERAEATRQDTPPAELKASRRISRRSGLASAIAMAMNDNVARRLQAARQP